LLRSGPPAEPSSPEFAQRIAGVGETFAQANVVAVYCIHGTFCGNDPLGLLTELSGMAPRLSESLRRASKGIVDFFLGETGNYTPHYVERAERLLSAGAPRPIDVRLFHWSSLNHHIGRADGAVRLIDDLARRASDWVSSTDVRPRVQLWGHSHGGNVMALASNLLGAKAEARAEFFHAARSFYRRGDGRRVDMPAWARVESLLAEPDHPVRSIKLDMVTYGMPVRYGWDPGGYAKLLHIVNHRPAADRAPHTAKYPPHFWRTLTGSGGDLMQHVGIAGTNFMPLPLAVRTWLADRRLGQLLQGQVEPRWLRSRLNLGVRVPEEGRTLLIDYDDPAWFPLSHFVGHAHYTRSRWLPLHCEQIAAHFYPEENKG
jgi:hypothetical protein